VIVVDASAMLDVLLRTEAAAAPEQKLFLARTSLHAPHLLDVEVAQVLRRYVLAGEIDAKRGQLALSDLVDFPIQRHPHDLFLPRVWELRRNLTAYDAVYVALAEVLDARLLTRDRRLARTANRLVRVDLV
jgi:predicted nucleic acid-binding protein